MTTDDLATALHACAAGLCPLEASVALLAGSGAFLHRPDFAGRFIEHGRADGTAMAAIDWDAAITALNGGELPCSGGERRLLLLSASLGEGIPVDLQAALTGLDRRNASRVIKAIAHAAGLSPDCRQPDGTTQGRDRWPAT